jgi:hypothetical protein
MLEEVYTSILVLEEIKTQAVVGISIYLETAIRVLMVN